MLVYGRLEATDYTDGSEAATSPLVESLRQKIACVEDPQFTKDYHDENMRTIPNALTVKLNDGTILEEEFRHRRSCQSTEPDRCCQCQSYLEVSNIIFDRDGYLRTTNHMDF